MVRKADLELQPLMTEPPEHGSSSAMRGQGDFPLEPILLDSTSAGISLQRGFATKTFSTFWVSHRSSPDGERSLASSSSS